MNRHLGRLALAALTAGLVGCDHVTKAMARASLSGGRTVGLVPGYLELVYAENRDAAFSALRSFDAPWKTTALGLVSAAMLVGILAFWWRRRREAHALEHAAFACLVAGALGNGVDRLWRGYVVDFIYFHVRSFHWPVFNVADALVVAAALLFAGASLRRSPPQPPPSEPALA